MAYNVAILGATGAVGEEILAILEERDFPINKLRLLASARSAGKSCSFRGKEIKIEEASPESFKGIDYVFSSAGGKISKELIPHAVKEGAKVIDNTSYFRMEPNVPLVVPEINAGSIKENSGIIANPNCNAIILSLVLGPLNKAYGIEHLFISTYQAASGGGKKMMEELKEESEAVLREEKYERSVSPYRYAFNCFIHNTPLQPDGYVEEEAKVMKELKKILEEPELKVNVNCIRVPVMRAHGEAINVQLKEKTSIAEISKLLEGASGVKVIKADDRGRWPTPVDASGMDDVLVGRIRKDSSRPNSFDIWLVGDQIRKGAALNAVQIGEALIRS